MPVGVKKKKTKKKTNYSQTVFVAAGHLGRHFSCNESIYGLPRHVIGGSRRQRPQKLPEFGS